MEPTTLRLPPDTLAELDSEYGDYGYASRSDYIRAIIEHRDPPFESEATTPATTRDYAGPTTDDYERLRDRVDQLEADLADLEHELNQHPDPDAVRPLVNKPGDVQPRAGPSLPAEPQGQDVGEAVVAWVREHGPTKKSEIVDAFADEWQERGIKGNSWYERHAKPALRESPAEHTRNVGWEINE